MKQWTLLGGCLRWLSATNLQRHAHIDATAIDDLLAARIPVSIADPQHRPDKVDLLGLVALVVRQQADGPLVRPMHDGDLAVLEVLPSIRAGGGPRRGARAS